MFEKLGQFYDEGKWKDDVPRGADWLVRLLTTKKTEARFRVAVWGLSVAEKRTVEKNVRIMPFDDLPNSFTKTRIAERASKRSDVVWLSTSFYGKPGIAVEMVVRDFPLISSDGACFAVVAELEARAKEFWSVIQATRVGRPLALCAWLDYTDRNFEIAEWEKWEHWILPEMHPHIVSSVAIGVSTIRSSWRSYMALPADMRPDLLRSIDRFVLSLYRRQAIDRVLDLVLAFEIAVGGGKGDNAPPSWKVAVRSSQMIGGALDVRQGLREKLNELYKMRSRATHGGRMKANERNKLNDAVERCSQIYLTLIDSFLRFKAKPDWNRIELEPRCRK